MSSSLVPQLIATFGGNIVITISIDIKQWPLIWSTCQVSNSSATLGAFALGNVIAWAATARPQIEEGGIAWKEGEHKVGDHLQEGRKA